MGCGEGRVTVVRPAAGENDSIPSEMLGPVSDSFVCGQPRLTHTHTVVRLGTIKH